MAKNIQTRIGLKIDTLAKWNESTIGLLPGELAIATVASGEGHQLSEPVIMIKIGEDGEKTFKDLDWALHAKASDVYSWAKQSEGDFVKNFFGMANAEGQTLEQLLDAKFATNGELATDVQTLRNEMTALGTTLRGELTEALKGYYTKDEIDSMIGDLDVGAMEGRIDDLETAVGTTIPAEIKKVDDKFADYTKTADLPTDLGDFTNNAGYAKTADVNGELAKKADADKVYTKTEADGKFLTEHQSLENYYTKGEADGKFLTEHQSLENYYTKDEVNNTVNGINGEIAKKADADKVYTKDDIDGKVNDINGAIALKADKSVVDAMYTNTQIDELVQGAKNYADANDANTTYTIGYESKVEGDNGHPARIVLTPSEGNPTYVDATPFIKDGMLDNVAYDDATNTLTFTFNTDAGKEAVTVELTDILPAYTGSEGTEIKVEVDGNVIKASLTEAVKNDIAKAKSDAADAVSAANSAATVAGEAKEAAEGAATVAGEAKEAAITAQNSATAKAEAAAASAEAAKGSEDAAKGYAEAAAADADDAEAARAAAVVAQGAAETAKGLAEDAKAAAVTAQSLAEGARDTAAQHKADAEAAKGAAETAKADALAAQAAAETAQSSAEGAESRAEAAQDAAEAAQAGAEAAKAAAEASNTSATAIANEAKGLAQDAVSTANTASQNASDALAKVNSLTTDDIDGGTEVWVFNCGTASTVI